MHQPEPSHDSSVQSRSSSLQISEIVRLARADGGGPIPNRIRFGAALSRIEKLGISPHTPVNALDLDTLAKLTDLASSVDRGIKDSQAGVLSVVGPNGCVRVLALGFNVGGSQGYAVAKDPGGALVINLITGEQRVLPGDSIETAGKIIFSPDGSRAFVRVVDSQTIRLIDLTKFQSIVAPANPFPSLRQSNSIGVPIFSPRGSIVVPVDSSGRSGLWNIARQKAPELVREEGLVLNCIKTLADKKEYAFYSYQSPVRDPKYSCPIDILTLRTVPHGSENASCVAPIVTPTGELYFVAVGWGASQIALCRITQNGPEDFPLPATLRERGAVTVESLTVGADGSAFIVCRVKPSVGGAFSDGLDTPRESFVLYFDGEDVQILSVPFGQQIGRDFVHIEQVGEPLSYNERTLFPLEWRHCSSSELPDFLEFKEGKLQFAADRKLSSGDCLSVIGSSGVGELNRFGVRNNFSTEYVSPDLLPAISSQRLQSGIAPVGHGLQWTRREVKNQAGDWEYSWALVRECNGAILWGEQRELANPGRLELVGNQIVVSAEVRERGWTMKVIGTVE